jgi:hypothetical protein
VDVRYTFRWWWRQLIAAHGGKPRFHNQAAPAQTLRLGAVVNSLRGFAIWIHPSISRGVLRFAQNSRLKPRKGQRYKSEKMSADYPDWRDKGRCGLRRPVLRIRRTFVYVRKSCERVMNVRRLRRLRQMATRITFILFCLSSVLSCESARLAKHAPKNQRNQRTIITRSRFAHISSEVSSRNLRVMVTRSPRRGASKCARDWRGLATAFGRRAKRWGRSA